MIRKAVQQLVRRQSIPWRIPVAGLALLAAASMVVRTGAAEADAMTGLRESPELLALVAPRLHREAYRTFVSAEPLDELLRRIAGDSRLGRPAGSWIAAPASAFDAFGDAGTYDRFRLARLYGSTRPRVARGPRVDVAGQTVEAWTLVSPYPDSSLSRLLPGTLVIVLRIPER